MTTALNADALAPLRDFMQPGELRDFLARVREELQTAWPQLDDQLRARDGSAVQRGAHRLKSVVGSVGCDDLYHQLNQLENSLRRQPGWLPGTQEIESLRAAVADADSALQRAIASP